MTEYRNSQPPADVFVVGGGPAGIAAALAARQHGLEVTIADGCVPPIDKPCGEGLMPDGVAALNKLGVRVPVADCQRFRGIRFVNGECSSEADFPSSCGLGIRRTVLHQILIEHAESAGVRFLWQAPVTGLHPDGVLLRGELHPARWILGADGSSSRVRRWAGLDAPNDNNHRFAFRRHYRVAPWSEFMEVHWADHYQLYFTPVSANEVCVALISRDPALRLDDALSSFPEMKRRLQGAEHSSTERGGVSMTRRFARVYKDRIALIGDASGSVDAITGEGLSLAFSQANLLGACLAAGNLAAYQSGHRKIARRPAIMSHLMLLLDRHRLIRSRVIRAFAAEPKIFAHMLATHVGEVSPLHLAANSLALGWKLVTA